jgi:hypothetical protein
MSDDRKIIFLRTDADGLANSTGEVIVVLELSRREIETGNIASALERLMVMTDTKENALRFQECLLINVTGYDDDSRELAEVPEVRRFMGDLIQQWPHWMWFLARDSGAIPLLMSLICKVQITRIDDMVGMAILDREELNSKMKDLLERGEAMFRAFDISTALSQASAISARAELNMP